MSAQLRTNDIETSTDKTRLSSQLLHDLRTPLNQIIGYSEMLTEDLDADLSARFSTDLYRIRDAGRTMLSLIEQNFTSASETSGPLTRRDDEESWPAAAPIRHHSVVEPGRLLVVDDDSTNQDVLSRRLKRQGHTVKTASSGRDALQLMREDQFDLVLLDVMMPEMDGFEVLKRIKTDAQLHHVPVIMISALHEVESVVRCIEEGAEDYLAKPFNPILLKARIGASLEKKRGRDRETALFEQLQQNYIRLLEVEKLRDDMRNMIVHDLRTPLTAVIVGVEMLAVHGALNETQQEMMSIAAGGGKVLLGMINDLLDVEKMESGKTQLEYTQLSAPQLVTGALAQIASLAEEGHTTVLTEIAPGLPHFPGDENLLSRTLVNLIANAIKFTRAGTVTITASQDGDGSILFGIRDTGAGIPHEAFERIFEKFGQVDSRRVGTGLGLAFCKLAVEAHGGHIQVESTPGVGSLFSFTVPQAATR